MSDPAPPASQSRPTQTMRSDQVRQRFTDIVAAAEQGTDTIVTWYGKRIAVVISYEDYLTMLEAHPC